MRPNSHRKRANSRRSTVTVPRNVNSCIAPRCITTHHLSASGYAQPAWGPTCYFQLGLNSPFLPLVTANPINTPFTLIGTTGASGLEPAGFTQMTSFYQSYRVQSCKVSFLWAIENVADVCHFAAYPVPKGATSVATTLQQITVQPNAKRIMIALGALTKENTFTKKYLCHELLGLTKSQYESLPATLNSSSQATTEELLLQCVIQTANNAGSTAQIYFSLDMFFEVEWNSPQLLTVT
jgi:hypothetical protein